MESGRNSVELRSRALPMQETKTKMPTTKEQVKAAIEVTRAIANAIRELHEVPSGHLYTQLMGHLSLDQYQAVIDGLERVKLIKVENYLITWIGPAASGARETRNT